MNHNLGARLDTTIAKHNFIEVCYDAGIVAVSRNKAQIEGEIYRHYKTRYSVQTIRKLYSRLVLELEEMKVRKFHQKRFRKYLLKELEYANVETFDQLYDHCKNKVWMGPFGTSTGLKNYLRRHQLAAEVTKCFKTHRSRRLQERRIYEPKFVEKILDSGEPNTEVKDTPDDSSNKKRKALQKGEAKKKIKQSRSETAIILLSLRS